MPVSEHLASLPKPGGYARYWKGVKALPPNAMVRLESHVESASLVVRDFARALDNRINVRGAVSMIGWDRWGDLVHDARVINDSKRRIRWSGRNLLNDKRLARRYPDINNPPND